MWSAGELQRARELGSSCSRCRKSRTRPSCPLPIAGGATLLRGALPQPATHLEQGKSEDDRQDRGQAFLYGGTQAPCLRLCALGSGGSAIPTRRYSAAKTPWRGRRSSAQASFAPSPGPWSLGRSVPPRGARRCKACRSPVGARGEQGFAYWEAMGRIMLGLDNAEQGQGVEGIAQIRQRMAAWQATGAPSGGPIYCAPGGGTETRARSRKG